MLRSLLNSALRSGAGAGATRSSGYGAQSRGAGRSAGFGSRGMSTRGTASRGTVGRGRSAGYPSARGGSLGGQIGGQVARTVLGRLTRGR